MPSVGALVTRMCVPLVPDSAFAAVNWTSYSPTSPASGVQSSVRGRVRTVGVERRSAGKARDGQRRDGVPVGIAGVDLDGERRPGRDFLQRRAR